MRQIAFENVHAAIARELGGPDVITIETVGEPELRQGTVRVAVHSAR